MYIWYAQQNFKDGEQLLLLYWSSMHFELTLTGTDVLAHLLTHLIIFLTFCIKINFHTFLFDVNHVPSPLYFVEVSIDSVTMSIPTTCNP